MSLHDRIREARKMKGLTQEELGKLIGVAKTTVAGYEKNREPTAATVGEIADALDVDANFLFQDEVKKYKKNHATAEEMHLIELYRLLDDYGRETVRLVLNREVSRASGNNISSNNETSCDSSDASDLTKEAIYTIENPNSGKGKKGA